MQKTLIRKGLVLGIIILFVGTSIVPNIGAFNSIQQTIIGKNMQNKSDIGIPSEPADKGTIKVADIITIWNEYGLCEDVNVTCYDHNVSWSADSFGTVGGCLLSTNWSVIILKRELILPRVAFFRIKIVDIERNLSIPFIFQMFFFPSFWSYGTQNFTRNIYISFNTKGRNYIPLETEVTVRGFAKSPEQDITNVDSDVSQINVTII